MSHPFHHLHLICKHRHHVIKNAAKMGIFWHALRHDMTKFGFPEFHLSAKYYAGDHSPVYEQRIRHGYFSSICQHHTKRNPHHWEYWTDFFQGRILMKAMPWKYATEYVCDMLSASYCYRPKQFQPETTLLYWQKYSPIYFMNSATKEYVEWCLTKYKESGFKELKKKQTKAKYEEIRAKYPEVELLETPKATSSLPPLVK
jgi:hypothetical protein